VICVVHINNLVIVIMVLIFTEMGMISHVVILFGQNRIKIIIIVVVSSIFCFVVYYIVGDVSVDNFKLVKLLFLSLMVLMLSSIGIVIFLRWERIRVISIMLIRYWIRPNRKSRAISAIIYNR
jgi:NADH:ubiquinone oxidoreductase subunit 5 (subunit L)/multisubunit Na+/H+ antiporter MnhA subunit